MQRVGERAAESKTQVPRRRRRRVAAHAQRAGGGHDAATGVQARQVPGVSCEHVLEKSQEQLKDKVV